MLTVPKSLPWLYALLLLTSRSYILLAECSLSGQDGYARNDALGRFFDSIDKDGNGQIEAKEASQYIADNFEEGDAVGSSVKAAQQMSKSLDGGDSDATVSKAEVETHLRHLLKGSRLTEWVKYSLQMPQYVDTFRQNAITSLDFPSLIANGGELLDTELGIKSKLHREQIARAMKRLLLGIGELPSGPQDFEAHAVQCNAVSVSWHSPANVGQPHFHRLRLERSKVSQTKAHKAKQVWELVAEDLDEESHSFLDSGIEAAEYVYRLTAWNALGRGEAAVSAKTSTKLASLSCPPGKCWRTGTCKAPTLYRLPDSGHYEAGSGYGSWLLVFCLLGVLLLGYSVVVFSTGKNFWHEFTEGLGLDCLLPARLRSKGPGDTIAVSAPSQRPQSTARAFSERLAVRDELQKPLHVFTDVRRGSFASGQGKDVSPSKKLWNPPSRSDFFSSGDIASLRGPSPQRVKTPGNSSTDNGSPLMSSEQQVLWLDDEGQEVEAPPALDIPASPKDIGRHGCAYPTCEKGLHPIFNPRSAVKSHYCSICQSVFCHRHTRYSPHGKLGSCGMESKCICQLCFDDLPRITQERLERTNKLQPKLRKEKDVQPSAASGSTKEKDSKRRMSVSKLGNGHSFAASNRSPHGAEDASLLVSSASERRAAQNWSKLRTTWRAILLFQGAGNDRRRRSDEGYESSAARQRTERKTQ